MKVTLGQSLELTRTQDLLGTLWPPLRAGDSEFQRRKKLAVRSAQLALYDRPQDWSPVTQSIVVTIFGGRLNTPLIGDAEAFHVERGIWTGKNALFFDGRAERAKRPE